jgi:hypothetical protein
MLVNMSVEQFVVGHGVSYRLMIHDLKSDRMLLVFCYRGLERLMICMHAARSLGTRSHRIHSLCRVLTQASVSLWEFHGR